MDATGRETAAIPVEKTRVPIETTRIPLESDRSPPDSVGIGRETALIPRNWTRRIGREIASIST